MRLNLLGNRERGPNVTNCADLPRTEGHLGIGLSSAKTGKLLGKPRQAFYPNWSPLVRKFSQVEKDNEIKNTWCHINLY